MPKITLRCTLDAGQWPADTLPAVVATSANGEVTSPPRSPFALDSLDPAVLSFLLDLAKDAAAPVIAAVMAALIARVGKTPAAEIRFNAGHEQITLPATATPEQIQAAADEVARLFAVETVATGGPAS